MKTGNRLSLMLVALIAGVSVFGWINLVEGEPIPIPFIEMDLPLDKTWLLIQMPFVALIIHFVFVGITKLSRRRENLEASKALYLSQWLGIQVAILALYGEVMAYAVNGTTLSYSAFLIVAGINAILIGNYMSKSRAHSAIGVATQSSMSNPDAWEKSHRVGGMLYMLSGVVILVLTFLDEPWLAITFGVWGALLAAMVAAYVARVVAREE